MIFDLIKEFADVLDAMPNEHPRYRIFKLLDEAIRRDVHFIDRHPTTFFQCMWNTCWWYDNPEAIHHYEPPTEGWPDEGPPWERAEPKLYPLVEAWEEERYRSVPGRCWFRSKRPPSSPLEMGLISVQQIASSPRALAASPDGKQLAIASTDNLQIIDFANDAQHHFPISLQSIGYEFRPDVQRLPPESVWFAPEQLATADGSSLDLQIWDTKTGSRSGFFYFDSDEASYDLPLPFSQLKSVRSGTFLAASQVSQIEWDWDQSKRFCFPKWLESSSEPPSMMTVWSTKFRRVVLKIHAIGACSSMAVSKDGNLVAIAWDRKVFVYQIGNELDQVASQCESETFNLHSIIDVNLSDVTTVSSFEVSSYFETIGKVEFFNDQQRLLVASPIGQIAAYDAFSGERIWAVENEEWLSKPKSPRICMTGEDSLVAAAWRIRVKVVGSDDGTQRYWLLGAQSDIEACVFLNDPPGMVALADKQLLFWRVASNSDSYFLKGSGDVGFALFNPESGQLVSESSEQISWWDAGTGRLLSSIPRDTRAWLNSIVGIYDGSISVINTSDKPPLQNESIRLIEGCFQQEGEAVFIRDRSRNIGWLQRIPFFTSHPEGNQIAGSTGNDVCLYELVGDIP